MKQLSWVKKALYSGVIFFGTLIILSFVYAATTYYSDLPGTSSGSTITASSWNNLVNYANKAVKQDTEVLTITGGKVGIGTVNPQARLDVNGKIKLLVDSTVQSSTADTIPEAYKFSNAECTLTTRGSMYVGRVSGDANQDALCVCMNIESVMEWVCFNP